MFIDIIAAHTKYSWVLSTSEVVLKYEYNCTEILDEYWVTSWRRSNLYLDQN